MKEVDDGEHLDLGFIMISVRFLILICMFWLKAAIEPKTETVGIQIINTWNLSIEISIIFYQELNQVKLTLLF